MVERIHFVLFGLQLQEPMAFITNWLIATICFFAYFKLRDNKSTLFIHYWKLFFVTMGISTILGGFSHLFFQYTGFYGKYPVWTLGVIAALMSCFAMLEVDNTMTNKKKKNLRNILLVKSIIVIIFSIAYNKFIFVTIDASVSYVIFCLIYGVYLVKKGYKAISLIVWAIIILLPSVGIFIGKVAISKWMNEQDIGHIIMMIGIYFFYLGVKKMTLSPKITSEK